MKNYETMTNPELDFDKVLRMYRQYCKRELEQGREPVTFQKFVSGQY